ncbi:MAG: hypothetical protein PHH14_04135 [Candidatus Margulisbacteria bacterium]|nr:hypothetical protein [Candidatus Margulisiibacteriota bacterium]
MRRALLAIIPLFILLVCSVQAEEPTIPVKVKADRLKYIEGTNRLEAAGSVEVKLKEVEIHSDRLVMDTGTDIATAEGHVRLFAKEYRAAAGRLTYDTKSDRSGFTDLKMQLSPKGVSGPVYLDSKEMTEVGGVMKGGDSEITTCNYEEPHFFLLADRIDYFPDDRFEGRNVTVYVGELPVLWLPYIYYDLKDQQKKNWTFGHTEVEGDFVKSGWALPAGLLLLDYMSKKGLGYGFEKPYGLPSLGSGKIYVYHLDEKDTGLSDWITKFDYQKKINSSTNFTFNQNYIDTYQLPSGRLDQTSLSLGLDHSGQESWRLKLSSLDDRIGNYQKYNFQFDESSDKFAANYNFTYEDSKNEPFWMRNSQKLYWRAPLLGNRLAVSSTVNYYRSTAYAGDSGEEKIEPQIDLNGSEPGFSWRLTRNWFIDLKEGLYPGNPRYNSLEKKPEIEIYPRTLDLPFFALQSTLGYGTYREIQYVSALGKRRDFQTGRYRMSLNAAKTVPLALGTTFTVGAGLDQYTYQTDDQLYALRENASLRTDLASFFLNEINFKQGYTEGNTPFLFDQLGTRYHDITEKMTFYRPGKFSWSIDGGHNWLTKKYYDVMTNLSVTPQPALRWAINTGWDIENTKYKDLVASLHYAPLTCFALDLALTQDLNLGQTKSGSALYDIYFLEGKPNQLHLRFSQVYDTTSREFKVRDIMVVKDLHCWEIKATYSDYRKEFSFTFTLKAIPGEPLGFSSGRGFYFDGFERQLQQLQSTGDVRRY